ncbi:MAG: glycosyltransferase family 1 protein [Micropruina sp.]|nr:glycosyltransferase family 1 protein [Micropruina sp.]
MKILAMTAGTRGDVEPFVALATAATAAGHQVSLAVTEEFADETAVEGVAIETIAGNFRAVIEAQGISGWAAAKAFRTTVAPMMARLLTSSAAIAMRTRPDVIVHHPKILSAELAAAALGIPAVVAEAVPVLTPTNEFPAPGIASGSLGPLNRLSYRAVAAAPLMFKQPLAELRAELGLPLTGRLPAPQLDLVTVSPALLPRPHDWPLSTQLTGQWLDPDASAGGPADDELDAFLEGGNVLYAGFGSMALGDPVARREAVLQAARQLGLRTLLVTGWGGLDASDLTPSPDVLVRASVPHRSVFPRCALAVHHGGAGTVHGVVRAGLPSVVVPFFADQPFWGDLLHRRGLAGPSVPASRLTAVRLAASLAAAPSAAAVELLGAAIRAEDGCRTALELLGTLGSAD